MTTPYHDNQNWPVIKIGGDESAPPYAAVTVLDVVEVVEGSVVITGRKPEAMDVFLPTVILGSLPGGDGGYSDYQDISQHFIARPAADMEAGEIVDVGVDWKLEPNSGGRWRFLGLVPEETDYGVFAPAGVGSAIFLVRMLKVDGKNGTSTSMNSWLYNVYRHGPGGVLIEAGIRVPYSGNIARRHDYQTQELGEVDPARSGLAYFDMFEGEEKIIIHRCDEQYRVAACEPDPVP